MFVAYKLTNLQETATNRAHAYRNSDKKAAGEWATRMDGKRVVNQRLFLHTRGVNKMCISRRSNNPCKCQTKQGDRMVRKTRRTDSRKGEEVAEGTISIAIHV